MAAPDIGKLKIDRGSLAPKRRRRIRWWMVVLALAVIGGGAMFLMPHPVAVQTASVVTRYPAQQVTVLTASGYVVAQRKAAVATKGTGRLEELRVQEGSRVKKGDLLARIDDRDVQAQLAAAVANVGVARALIASAEADQRNSAIELKRSRGLVTQGFVSGSALDAAVARDDRATAAINNARAGLQAALANANAARVAVDFTQIRAPFDGVVVTKSANVGDIVTPFSSAVDSKGAVVNMADLSTLEVEADVSESSLSKITVGQPCEILLDALPDSRFSGSVSRIVPTVDRSKATVTTKVRFDKLDDRILPDMSAKVSFLSAKVDQAANKPTIAVSNDVVVKRDGKPTVFRLKTDGDKTTAEAVVVTTGATYPDAIEITSGNLKSGEKLIVKPADKIKNGTPVALQTK
ncbi:MAG: efflux RND transporter periplasmic adaptor subunit [Burkholderiaceae bacterium]